MTTSIPTKSPDHSCAHGASSASSFFAADAGKSDAPADFAALLDGNAASPAPASAETAGATAGVLSGQAVASTVAAQDADEDAAVQTPTREAIEQAAALLASLWNALQPDTPVQAGALPDTGAAAAADLKVTLQWGEQSPIVLSLPAGAQPPADLEAQVSKQVLAFFGKGAAPSTSTEPADGAGFPLPDGQASEMPELSISMDIAATMGAKGALKVSGTGAEKFAGKFLLSDRFGESRGNAPEKNFLIGEDEEVTEAKPADGIGVAKSSATMPAFFATRQITPERFASAVHGWTNDSASTQPAAESMAAPAESTAAASLARRAVETIQGVIETQHIRTDHMGVVSLNFKFGAEDLAVRVQLRNGEVHTQFRTDSPELRAALSDEWHALAVGQGGDAGSRLIEPVFAPSNSSLSQQHSGSGSSGQGFAQKQQQEAQAPFALPEVRTFRRGLGAATAAASEVAPQIARSLPTSLHFTAFA